MRRVPHPTSVILAVLAAWCGLTLRAWAQTPLADVQKWVDTQAALGDSLGNNLLIEARWSRTMRTPVDAATKAMLSQDLSKTPDHPMHGRQQQMRKRAEAGLTTDRTLIAGEGRWRLASVERDDPDTLWHTGGAKGDCWMWSGEEVTVVDAKHPPGGRDWSSLRHEYLDDVLNFLSGGLAGIPPRTFAWTVLAFDGSVWTAHADDGTDHQYEASGVWDASQLHGEVRSIRVTGKYPRVVTFSDWGTRKRFWTAGTVEYQSASGYFQRNTLAHVSAPDVARVTTLSKVPSAQSGDELHDGLTPRVVIDLRGAQPTAVAMTPRGMAEVEIVETPEFRARRRLRWAGWAVGIGVAGVSLAFWLRKRSQTAGGL